MVLLALVTLADLRLAASSRVVPYVVQCRSGWGSGHGRPAEDLKQPDQRLLASELARSSRDPHGPPAAAAAGQAEMLRRGYAFVGPAASSFLNDYFAQPEHDPRLLGLRLTRRQVDVAERAARPQLRRLAAAVDRGPERSTQAGVTGAPSPGRAISPCNSSHQRRPSACKTIRLGLSITSGAGRRCRGRVQLDSRLQEHTMNQMRQHSEGGPTPVGTALLVAMAPSVRRCRRPRNSHRPPRPQRPRILVSPLRHESAHLAHGRRPPRRS